MPKKKSTKQRDAERQARARKRLADAQAKLLAFVRHKHPDAELWTPGVASALLASGEVTDDEIDAAVEKGTFAYSPSERLFISLPDLVE